MELRHKKTAAFKHTIYIIGVWLVLMPNPIWANFQPIKNPEVIFHHYETSASNYMRQFDLYHAKIYLDSASLFIKKVNDPVLIGFYYEVSGNFYSAKQNDSEAHKNYYQAIDYYERSEEPYQSNRIYYNLARAYYQKQDTNMFGKLVSKMKLSASKQENERNILDLNGIEALYYHCLYNKDSNNTAWLDSVVFYETQFVTRFEADTSFRDSRGDVAFNYMMLAHSMTKLKKYNPDSIDYYLEKMKHWTNPLDTAMIVNQLGIEGEIAFDKKQFPEAKKIFNQSLTLLDNWTRNNNPSIYIDIYGRLSEIAEIEKDYRLALDYERKKTQWAKDIYDMKQYKTIRELSEKYESEKRDREIDQLRFREKITWLYLSICVLGLLTSFFIIRWLFSRKKAMDSQLLLMQMEKDEIKLHDRLKDEMLKNAKLEKYEFLLDIHFKNLDISEKDETIIGLENEQIKLNKQIQNYTNRLQRYEGKDFVSSIEDPYFLNIAQDVYKQILKKSTNFNEKDHCLKVLQRLNNKFFLNLKNQMQENLSVLNIKYCICFAIGMKAKDIAECFCVELRSVHMVRHRLRSKMNLDKTTDFNLFLRQLID